ncbi:MULTISPECIES: Stk1 family PASTA domain-containing Ser/Thr kinase [Streptomyces]|uniref:non-specific serine/threonine protein kinase n=1 Tax=Streptomyces tsukubensis (strain DSM 42081 / NBRC 108919 / NRRL 18488 / 9993) TaxID=1114943 RepID=I2MWX9_STRT9|nr:Stk1 family PASTA domain-containing Ser/Thr kinase [Streptomyces tsukubensis]MYS63707.1 Stk1 family PASTA domain-containing Ser/Thr kinase [Streptomyces sp. SID5473]AZK93674.1 serine/threonine protein kinase [Streptomyces tsukubensis]EIF89276.1 serine/threonine protein kinase [Streptomyces tsukubensis NRRL18488]QKM70181.1 Stk1 family PASTA domain-containing Ser/Thr kinase [Streptomyces tsukubensis NRRL18488]TAI45840.1 Stk1 family PASTA domain-containing Ser/Thr kinase [Streptomyces tsukuben
MDTTLQDPLVGQVLDGRYRVDERIAVGGMATVYRALDTRLDRELALKVMHPALATDATFVERFIREAKSVARLSHPNVVGVFDQGAEGAYVYLAMEYVAGCTLRDVLRERGALRPRAALDILEPVLAALGAAHRAGFVHRDVKPENVLIGDDGRVKVADFGLVRAVGSVTNTTGSVLGTVSYLAPEQIEDGTADTRSDVYACGVVLYEMLTGAKPYAGDTPAQVLYQHLHDSVPAPSAAVPGLALELDELVASATARTPGVRPYDAVALLAQARTARAALDDEQLDLLPPGAREIGDAPSGARGGRARRTGSEERTDVIPRTSGVLPDEQRVQHTAWLAAPLPPAGRARAGRRDLPRLTRRGVITIVVAVLAVFGIAGGVWYINSGQFTRVPAVIGLTEAAAEKRIEDAGLGVKGVRREFSDTVERGSVIWSDPVTNERIRGNGSVTLVVSRGPEIVRVPSLKDVPQEEAEERLRKAGFAPGAVSLEFSAEVPQGAVIRTDPAAGTGRRPDSAVSLVVSKGAPVEVPDVMGDPVAEATAALKGAGFEVAVEPEQVNSPEAAGTVARQSAPEGTRLAGGDTITLTVSKGPRMVAVPDVSGSSESDARRELEAAGFEVKVEKSFPYLGDKVSGQSPSADERAPEGSTVTITLKGL